MSADNAVPANIITAMDSTAFRGLNANSSEEMMPLPYWKEPSAKTIMTEHWGWRFTHSTPIF